MNKKKNSDLKNAQNPKLWFEFYIPSLLKFWESEPKRTKEQLYRIIAKYLDIESNSVKRNFIDYFSLPKDYIKIVSCLLVPSKFYENFFNIGMLHRLDKKNTLDEITIYYKFLKQNTHQEDLFWFRWVFLFELRYMQKESFSEIIELYESIFQTVQSNFYENYYQKEIEFLKRIDGNYYELISKYSQILNSFYNITFFLNYRSFLHEKILSLNEKFQENQKNLQEIHISINKEFEKLYSLGMSEISKFRYDFRMLEIYFHGNQIFYYGDFKTLSANSQKEHLEKVKNYLQNYRPQETDSIDYKIWYSYYELVLEKYLLEHEIKKGNLEIARELCKKCISLFEKLDAELKGGFLRMHLKIMNHLRLLYYFLYTIELQITEKSLGLSLSSYSFSSEISQKRREEFLKVMDYLETSLIELR